MSKKKIVILIVAIIIALIIGVTIYLVAFPSKINNSEDKSSKVTKLYNELQEKQTYSFITTLNKQNSTFYAKKDRTAYINTTYQGKVTEILIKEGNTYLLKDDEKIYYTYKNNETDLEKISVELNEIKEKEYIEGKEKIENKEYKYEEYEGATDFLIKDIEDSELASAKTRFYFKSDNLVYIKTIIGDYEEILKVEIFDDVDNKLFEIPKAYKEM